MEKLIEMGISEEELNEMLELNPELLDEKDLCMLVDVLSLINCDNMIIKNILVSNPLYLSRTIEDVVKLINKFIELGFKNLDILFDSNPYLLDLDDNDVENFMIEHKLSNKDFINILDNNPFAMDEI